MGYMIEIEKGDAMALSEHIEKALKHAGKAMQIAEDMCEGSNMGYRGNYGNRGDMGMRSNYRNMGYRDEEEDMYDDYGNPRMGMRGRMRDSRGRFI